MLFSSITFLYYFLPAVLVIYYLTPAKVKNLILFLASFVFYLWGEPKYSVLLLFSVAAGYMGGRCIEYQRQKKCVSAADPADRSGKYKGGHDRLVVVLFSFVIFRVESVREIKEQLLGLAGSYGNAMTPMAAYEIKSYLILFEIKGYLKFSGNVKPNIFPSPIAISL